MSSIVRNRILNDINASAALTLSCADALTPQIVAAVDLLINAFSAGNKVLACGNGGSAGQCQHFAAELVGRFEQERPPLPALSLTADTSVLTAIANDYEFDQVFAKQVQALGQAGDLLLTLSTSGNSPNVIRAIEAAHERDMHVIALTGKDGGKIAGLVGGVDVHICVKHTRTAHVQEIHALIIHCLCDGIDFVLFGDNG
jgi:D-sedoheptulose 7-phosphate isomerase